jgi:RNA polymerase sigma-70 factor (ECF subfamily)
LLTACSALRGAPVGRSGYPDCVPTDWTRLSATDAIPRLLDEHGGKLYGLSFRLCGSRDDADDIVQETFLQAFRKWDQFQGRRGAQPSTWLYTIAARLCHRKRRRRSGQPTSIASLESLMPSGPAPIADPKAEPVFEKVARREALEAVEAQILKLPDAFRMALVFKDVLDLPVTEAAAALNIRENTLKTRVHRARMMLRKALDGRVPSRKLPPPAYDRQVCMDLLRAKQQALDAGRDFPVQNKLVCERCRAVFAGLDLAADTCRLLAQGKLPAPLRKAVLEGIDARRASPSPRPKSPRSRPRRARAVRN